MEHAMRSILFAASVAAGIAVPGAASAQYYYNGGYAPPTTYVAPGAPMVQGQVYLAPGAPTITVTPGQTYDDQAIYMNGERYYRDCWWDWGRRRCELKRWW
jgi:hypothetical protein